MKPHKINLVKAITVIGGTSQRNGTKIVCRNESLMGKYVWPFSPSQPYIGGKLRKLLEKNNNCRGCRDSVYIFSTKPCLKMLSLGKTQRELNGMNHGAKAGSSKEPIFNLVPVLGAGNSSASLDDIITCELFALRS